MIDSNITKNIKTNYFAHYKTLEEGKQDYFGDTFCIEFIKNIDELSKNDWKFHRRLVREGVNPSYIAKVIRSDDIKILQEISSQNNFDFNQTIEPSLYERFSYINENNVSLIDYAAFFGSTKCFKFLMLNGSDLKNTAKFVVASGNEEIIKLCE